MKRLRPLLLLLATGYILTFYSEVLFWARPRPGDSFSGWIGVWLYYSVTTFAFLAVVKRFGIRGPWALFLAGGLFGWLVEGILANTMYEEFPYQIPFTGLAWHALISVLVGWYLVRKVLLQKRPLKALLLSGALGLFWGLWSLSWWIEEPASIATVPAFVLFAFTGTLLLVAAYRAYDRLEPATFEPRGWAIWLNALFFAFIFIFGTLPLYPWAPLLLLPLLALIFLALRRHRRTSSGPDVMEALVGRARPSNYLLLLLMPLVATVVYALATLLDLRFAANAWVYVLTTPLSTVAFVIAVVKCLRREATPVEASYAKLSL
ncbi:MAG: hypothetical protein ACLFU8_08080 [Anaerolineales bacterium]